MLGRKIFSMLCLLALTVLLGACGSEEQTVAVNAPVENVDNGQGDQSVNPGTSLNGNSGDQSSMKTLTGGVAEFKALVERGEFISAQNYKSLMNISSYDNIGLQYFAVSGTNWDLFDAEYSKEGGFGNALANFGKGILDALTPDVDFSGNTSWPVKRTIYGDSIMRRDGMSAEELLEDFKVLVNHGTFKLNIYSVTGNASFLIEHNNIEYTIDLNTPLMANPVRVRKKNNDGSFEMYQFYRHTQAW